MVWQFSSRDSQESSFHSPLVVYFLFTVYPAVSGSPLSQFGAILFRVRTEVVRHTLCVRWFAWQPGRVDRARVRGYIWCRKEGRLGEMERGCAPVYCLTSVRYMFAHDVCATWRMYWDVLWSHVTLWASHYQCTLGRRMQCYESHQADAQVNLPHRVTLQSVRHICCPTLVKDAFFTECRCLNSLVDTITPHC